MYCWNDERNNFERLNEAFTQVENPINVFLHSQLFSSEIKTVGLYVLQRHTRPCLYCGKPQQEENQPGSVWLRWQKYKVYRHLRSCWLDQIFFCHNFRKLFFSFGAQLFTSTKTEFRQYINREIMHFIEFFPSKWDLRCCFTRQHQRTSGHRATWNLRWKSFFLVDVCLF